MQERPIRVLLVDDEEDSYVLTRHLLNAIPGERFELEWAPTYADGMRAIGRGDYDICLVDQRLDCGEGLELIRRAVSNGCRAPMILLTAYGDRQTDLRAMEGGAAAYLDKARLEAPVLERAIRYAIHHASRYQRLAEQARRLRQEMSERYEMVGESEPMRAVYDLIARVAPTRAGVLICGESGTGKEMVARAIHMNSNLADGPLEIVNCAAVPPGLIESELFGHVRGAFTGAVSDRPGRFELADGGTLFLDEVIELPPECQSKLLRVIEEGHVRRVGDTKDRRVNVRLIAATNRSVERALAEGQLRRDLFYRLDRIRITLPPLRERGDDIELLARHFLNEFCLQCKRHIAGFAPEVLKAFRAYPWPGNVRELQNVVERMVILGDGPVLQLRDVPAEIVEAVGKPEQASVEPLQEVEKRHILGVLRFTGGNKKRAAELLGIDRSTLYAKLRKYGGNAGEKPGGASFE